MSTLALLQKVISLPAAHLWSANLSTEWNTASR